MISVDVNRLFGFLSQFSDKDENAILAYNDSIHKIKFIKIISGLNNVKIFFITKVEKGHWKLPNNNLVLINIED